MPRVFTSSGTTRIACNIGACSITGDITIATIMRRTTNGVLHVVFYVGSATSGTARIQLALQVGDEIQLREGANIVAGNDLLASHNWVLLAVNKVGGTNTPRHHFYVYDTNTWLHADFGVTLANPTAPATSLYHGDWSSGGDALGGDIMRTGMWNASLSDSQIESLAFNRSAWYAVPPLGIWDLDQSTTAMAVNDETGRGATQSGTTGPPGISTASSPIWTPGMAAVACC